MTPRRSKIRRTVLYGLLLTALSWSGWASAAGTASAAGPEAAFIGVKMNTDRPALYDKFEMTFDLDKAYENPFDPAEVDVEAVVTTPSGLTEAVPGFYRSDSSPKWAVRYSPRETGRYQVMLSVTDATGTVNSRPYAFSAVGAGAGRGFMTAGGSRFLDSYGKQLTLIGTNYAWGAPDEILAAMPAYNAAGMNIMRVWYSVWWGNYAPEWGPTVTTQNGIPMSYEGIGRYQLENQARMDTLMDTAAGNDIYLMLTINSFGDFYYDWPQNAYNTANGGPSNWKENDTDFWFNPAAISYQKNLLRYVFARWGYSRALGIVEYWNESDNRVDTDAVTRAAWHDAVDSYWKSLDFYHHPTTTSFAWKDHHEFNQISWENLKTLDATNFHLYESSPNAIEKWEDELKHFAAAFGGRPAFVGEFGINGGGEDPSDPAVQRYVHDGLWAPIFRAGAAGGNLFWEFSGNIGFNVPANIKALHAALAGFIRSEEAYLPAMPFADFGLQPNGTKVGGYTGGDRALLWINDTQADYTVASPRKVSEMALSIPGMNNGAYDVTFVNTVTGDIVALTKENATGGALRIGSVPAFSRDIAVKAVRRGSEHPDHKAPSAPTGLTSRAQTDRSVSLAWQPSSDKQGTIGYVIYRNGIPAGFTAGVASSYTDTALASNTAYIYTVRAKDGAGNLSASSPAITVRTLVTDTQAPSVPAGLEAAGWTTSTANLTWQPATDDRAVTGYLVYRGQTLVASVTDTSYADTGLKQGTAYTYTVAARDAAGNYSERSSAVTVLTDASSAVNILPNPGFETDDGSGKPADWTCEQDWYCVRDTVVVHSGLSSLKVEGNTGAWFGLSSSAAPAEPNKAYTLDGYLNIPNNGGTGIQVKVQFLDDGGNLIGEHAAAYFNGTTSGFQNVYGVFTSPSGTAKARIYVYLSGLNAVLYLDDFTLSTD